MVWKHAWVAFIMLERALVGFTNIKNNRNHMSIIFKILPLKGQARQKIKEAKLNRIKKINNWIHFDLFLPSELRYLLK